VLRNTSTLVKTPAPGIVYKNMDIWVGTSGFATPRNMKNAEIMFRVEKAWVNEGTTALYRYDGDWVELPPKK
jgi:PGF-pre-PGF domain-containing protein